MAQYRNINVRSPFYMQLATSQTTAYLSIKIWNGHKTNDKPSDATYTLEKEQTGGQATFEIAELIRDYCSQTSTLSSGTAWVETTLDDLNASPTVTTYLATEGYSLYREGVQHNGNSFESDFVALPEDTTDNYRILSTESNPSVFHVYAQPQNSTDWKYRAYDLSGNAGSWITLPITAESSEQFVPITASTSKSRYEFDLNGTVQNVYVDKTVCTKYSAFQLASNDDKAVVLFYTNKFGVKNYFPFTMKHKEDVKVKSDQFQRNVMNFGSLSNGGGLHASRKRITGSKQSFTINTDWISEYYVKQLEELLMSEYVWALIPNVDSTNFQPMNLTTSNLSKKNHLNDRMIQYTFTMENASEYINTVR